jgi:hypothetical protein
MRWWSRHSPQTQPCAYAALVPCGRSSRRVAVKVASSAEDHSSSVLVSPTPGWRSGQGHGARPGTAGRCTSRRGAAAAARLVTASALGLVRGPSPRRSGLHGIGRSRSLPASGSGYRAAPEGHGGDPGDPSHHGPDATAALSTAAPVSGPGRATVGRQAASHCRPQPLGELT